MPNNYNYWKRYTEKDSDGNEKDVTWKNYYAVLFGSSSEACRYSLSNWDSFYRKTSEYKNAVFSSSLPESVKEAAGSNVAVLKSPTVMRLEDGQFYGWEGVWENSGSCEGTCTHVWNYAYALCFLFPKLLHLLYSIPQSCESFKAFSECMTINEKELYRQIQRICESEELRPRETMA